MNKFVAKWKRYESRAKSVGPDSVSLGDEKYTLKQGENREKPIMKNPSHKASVNEGALKELILFAPEEKVGVFTQLFKNTLKRLGVKRFRGVHPFTKFGSYKGSRPSPLDVKTWLSDLDAKDPRYAADILFLKRIYVTATQRDFTPLDDE